ncbi:MAG: B12-binding domain-containing radical SAM protein [Desulfitobacteriia bacterium]
MRILFISLNASYGHTNLAIRYLRQVLLEQNNEEWEVRIREFTINESLERIAAEIYLEKPDVLGFSCYIWNLDPIRALVRRLRPVLPQTFFLGGGPEVSFDSENFLERHPEWDGIIVGEGEIPIKELITVLASGRDLSEVQGLVWRCRPPKGPSFIVKNRETSMRVDLNKIPNPYSLEEDFTSKLVYVETSRGCPFQCQFCISSTFRGIKYLEPEKFRPLLRRLFELGATTIKFVDRTFNCSKKQAFAILDIFREEAQKRIAEGTNSGVLRAHCEMAGELLDKEWLEYLKDYPPGMIQLEIGVQSTYLPTLKAIKRPQNFSVWREKVEFLQHKCRIPIHLDLIAGLPLEGWFDFRNSFNDVFKVRPNHLQLGFLKILKGSGLWEKSEEYGIKYSPDPPYTVLETSAMTHAELIRLTEIEEVLEKYYNSGHFKFSLEYILTEENPFDFFNDLAAYWREKGWFRRQWGPKSLYENLWIFLTDHWKEPEKERIKVLTREALRFDYYLFGRPGLVPESLKSEDLIKDQAVLKEAFRNASLKFDLPKTARGLDKRQWARATAVESFAVDVPGFLQQPLAAKDQTSPVCYLFYYEPKETKYFKIPTKFLCQ